tara:strand:+ start:1988 stop:2293 length:306 start_codon:yes stop_codon:yes gene_type:complete
MPFNKKGTQQKINSKHSIYDLSKYIIWVVRISNNKEEIDNNDLIDAAPCSRCCKSLYKLGFTKIGFSNKNGEIEIADLRYYQNDHISHSQKKSEQFCKYIL